MPANYPPPPAPQAPPPPPPRAPEGHKSYIATLLFSFSLGFFGVDRFYLGKTGTAVAKLLTFGSFGYWWLINIFITLFGGQRDAQGFRLAGYDRFKKPVWAVVGILFGASFVSGLFSGAVASASGPDGLSPAGWVVLAVGAAGVAVAATAGFRRRDRRTRRVSAGPSTSHPASPLSAAMRSSLAQLEGLRGQYVPHAAAGNRAAASIIRSLDSLQTNMPELFVRLSAKTQTAERRRADAEYLDALAKLTSALGRGYLLDIITNPHYWDAPEQLAQRVQAAVEAIDAQVLGNIRQVNAQHSLRFEVSLDGLRGSQGERDDWQRRFNDAAGLS